MNIEKVIEGIMTFSGTVAFTAWIFCIITLNILFSICLVVASISTLIFILSSIAWWHNINKV